MEQRERITSLLILVRKYVGHSNGQDGVSDKMATYENIIFFLRHIYCHPDDMVTHQPIFSSQLNPHAPGIFSLPGLDMDLAHGKPFKHILSTERQDENIDQCRAGSLGRILALVEDFDIAFDAVQARAVAIDIFCLRKGNEDLIRQYLQVFEVRLDLPRHAREQMVIVDVFKQNAAVFPVLVL